MKYDRKWVKAQKADGNGYVRDRRPGRSGNPPVTKRKGKGKATNSKGATKNRRRAKGRGSDEMGIRYVGHDAVERKAASDIASRRRKRTKGTRSSTRRRRRSKS